MKIGTNNVEKNLIYNYYSANRQVKYYPNDQIDKHNFQIVFLNNYMNNDVVYLPNIWAAATAN